MTKPKYEVLDALQVNTDAFPHIPGIAEIQQARSFFPFSVGPYNLSVQASHFHYCMPRHTFADPHAYTSMEIALIRQETGEMLDVSKEFPGFIHNKALLECFDGDVYSYVPVRIINALYLYLYHKYMNEKEGIQP